MVNVLGTVPLTRGTQLEFCTLSFVWPQLWQLQTFGDCTSVLEIVLIYLSLC